MADANPSNSGQKTEAPKKEETNKDLAPKNGDPGTSFKTQRGGIRTDR